MKNRPQPTIRILAFGLIIGLMLPTTAQGAPGSSPPQTDDAVAKKVTPKVSSTSTKKAGHKVLMLGIDAADIDVITPLLEAGELPNLKKLADAGIFQALNSHQPTRSPAVWTTIATGVRKETHGIYDYVTNSYYNPKELRSKEKILTTSDMRKTPAIWNVMSDAGRKSVVAGWLSTWPAEDIKGAMVAPFIDIGNTRQTTIKGSIYKTGAPKQTFSPALFKELRPLLDDPNKYGRKQRQRYYNELPDDSPIYKQIPILKRYNYTASWSAARQHNVTSSATYLAKKIHPELVMVYYQCPDSFGHRFWHFRLPEKDLAKRLEWLGADPGQASDLKQRYGHAIDNCYRELDVITGKLMQSLGPDFSVMIMSDHGFGENKFSKPNKKVPFNGGHRDQGLVILSGPAFKQGVTLKKPVVEDLAPTAMQVLGLPVPAYVEGRVLDEGLAE